MLRKLEIVVRRLRLYPDNMRISKIVLVWLRVCLSFEMVSLFFFLVLVCKVYCIGWACDDIANPPKYIRGERRLETRKRYTGTSIRRTNQFGASVPFSGFDFCLEERDGGVGIGIWRCGCACGWGEGEG